MEIAVKITDKNFEDLDPGMSIFVHYPEMPLEALKKKMPQVYDLISLKIVC